MSLNRIVTRLAVVHALNNYLEEPWPTLAGSQIFDSKIEPIEDMKLDQAFPCVVVYTDYDKDHWTKAKKAHGDRTMSVTLELLVVQANEVSPEAGPAFQLTCPYTDSEIEYVLDILETQAFRALEKGTEASDAFNYICHASEATISRRGASTEGGRRLAARQITMEMKAVRDNIAGVIPAPIEAFFAKLEAHADYKDRVPELRAMMTAPASDTPFERQMKTFGYSRDVMARLGGAVSTSILPPNLVFNLNDPPSTGGAP